MKAPLTQYFKTYFTSWWMPLAHYLVALTLLVALLASGVQMAFFLMLCLFSVLATLLVIFAVGMLTAAFVNFYMKRKLEGLTNLILFLCLFLLPGLLYYSIITLMTGL